MTRGTSLGSGGRYSPLLAVYTRPGLSDGAERGTFHSASLPTSAAHVLRAFAKCAVSVRFFFGRVPFVTMQTWILFRRHLNNSRI